MILGLRHKALRLLFEKGDRSRLPSQYVDKIGRILSRLEVAEDATDMDLPGFRLPPLTANLAGMWSVSVSRNTRIVFRFDSGNADEIDMIDYH